MKTFRVVGQRVEINGKTREVGDELLATDFKPASGNQVPDEAGELVPELSELESLLQTGHVEQI